MTKPRLFINGYGVADVPFGYGSGYANSLCYRQEITEITQEMWASIADGTFSKVHTGMHYTAPSGRTYWFADADYFFGTGQTEQTAHHMLVIEDEISHTAKHQNSNTTSGGATASLIYTTTLPNYQSELETDFGASHIKSQSVLLSNTVASGSPSGWAWTSKSALLMNANMVFGNPIMNTKDVAEMYNGGNRCRQLSLFQSMPETIVARSSGARADYWLDDVESDSFFGFVESTGIKNRNNAAAEFGIRRAFLIG